MIVESYTDKYYDDIVQLSYNFYKEAFKDFCVDFKEEDIKDSIDKCKAQGFLLIKEGKVEGVLAGIESSNPMSDDRVFQEVIWYVNQPYRKYGVFLLHKAEQLLKERGFTVCIMACLHNSMTDKLFKFYQKVGYQPIETHFIRRI